MKTLLIALSLSALAVVSFSYKIPNLENHCRYLDTSKRVYECQHFNLSQYADEPIDINYDGFAAFTHASILIFQSCNLPTLPKNYFGAFPRVVNMTIINCELSINAPLVPPLGIQRSLTVINLSGNKIDNSIPIIAFSALKSLENINLSRNLLTSVNSLFLSNEKLEILDLHQNKITKLLDQDLAQLVKLSTLDLSKNLISEFDEKVFQKNEDLIELNLSGNKIQNLPGKLLESLVKLQNLNLSENLITTIPENFFINTTELKVLDIRFNNIKALNTQLFIKLTSLTFLGLSDNELESLSTEHFTTQTNLRSLYLRNNKISDFKTNGTQLFETFSKILTFDISNNPKYSDKSLDIKTNYLDFPNLLLLNLSATNIKDLNFNSFYHFTKLRTLDLSFNSLNKLDMHILYPLTSLASLYVSGNNLTEIDFQNEKIFKSGLKVDLVDNKWNCSYLSKMTKYFNIYNIDYLAPWHYIPKTTQNIGGIECYGLSDDLVEDKAEEVLEEHSSEETNKINNKQDNQLNEKFSKFERLLENDHQYYVNKAHNVDEFRENMKNNYTFLYFLVIGILSMIVVLSVWNFVTIRSLRNLARIQQRVSFEANLLDNIQ